MGRMYGSNEDKPPIDLPLADCDILNYLEDAEDKEPADKLYDEHPAAWLVGCIALHSGRKPSEIPYTELAAMYVGFGHAKWEEHVSNGVADYLRRNGEEVRVVLPPENNYPWSFFAQDPIQN